MRITNSMVMSQYTKQLNKNMDRVSTDTQKLSSGQMYSRASQDPVDAAQMIYANGQLKTIERYRSNIENAQSLLTDTESAVNKTYYNVLQAANTTLDQAANSGTNSNVNNEALAGDLQTEQTEVLSALNAESSSGQYDFGGKTSGDPPFKAGTADDYTAYTTAVTNYQDTYNSTYTSAITAGATAADAQTKAQAAALKAAGDMAPVGTIVTDSETGNITLTATLTEDDFNGKLLYQVPATGQYVPASQINNSTASTDPTSASYYSINNSAMTRSYPIDLGYGAQMDASGNVESGTAFEAYTNPLDFLLQNVTATGSSNVYDDYGTTAAALQNNDTSTVAASQTLNSNSMDSASLTNSILGAKQNMLTFLSNKYDTDNTNATSRLSKVEDVDTSTAYSQYSLHLMAYQATLAISSSVLQNNLTDYLK